MPCQLPCVPFLLSSTYINANSLTNLGLGKSLLYMTPGAILFHFKDHLEWLNLSYNYFTFLGHLSLYSNNFPPMKNLDTLLIKYSEIYSIHPDTFQPLYNLKHLDLTGNGLTFVPNGVLLPTLETLDLSFQNYSTFTLDVFQIPFILGMFQSLIF